MIGIGQARPNCPHYAQYSEMHGPRNLNVHAPSQVCACVSVCVCFSGDCKCVLRVNPNAMRFESESQRSISSPHIVDYTRLCSYTSVFAGGVCRGPS